MATRLLDRRNSKTPQAVAANAPAKINLILDILGPRPDGYHDLRSLVVGVGLCDDVSCELRSEPAIDVQCTDPALNGRANLAFTAAQTVARACDVRCGARIRVEKRIPVGAGLGGGSSNAAATLRLCNRVWNTGLSHAELAVLGSRVGSDVPLFFSLPSAVMEGRGERVCPTAIRWAGSVLLIFPGFSVSTANVYSAWRAGDARKTRSSDIEAACGASTADELNALLSNQLEPAVFRTSPRLAELRNSLEQDAGVGPLRVSGSGSTLFRLFDDAAAARRAERSIHNHLPGLRTFLVEAPVQARWELFEHEES
jgi:4-diphosphocytidyl-2-C-methyl-D-erythritol kinase